MPIGEIETHPFLNTQGGGQDEASLRRYRFVIVGTFPIYPLTLSTPIDGVGALLKANWNQHARFQFFYGSSENHFWDLFSSAFNQPHPQTSLDAITLLDTYGFILTDVVATTQRHGYSPSDQSINANKILNIAQLTGYLHNIKNLEAIFFTSFTAKEWFCRALGLPYQHLIIDHLNHLGKKICLFVLMSPAGSGRSINTYTPIFPLNAAEVLNRENGIPYDKNYRKRYYSAFLNLTINC